MLQILKKIQSLVQFITTVSYNLFWTKNFCQTLVVDKTDSKITFEHRLSKR